MGVEKVSGGKISAVLTLILMLLLSIVGLAILQSEYNKLNEAPAGGGPAPTPPTAPPAGPQPPSRAPRSLKPCQNRGNLLKFSSCRLQT